MSAMNIRWRGAFANSGKQARELGLLGKNIMGSSFSFDVDIARGGGAFV